MDETKKGESSYMSMMRSPERFQRLEDGWVRDLMLGVEWGPSSKETMDHQAAKKYCEDLGARLPEVHELHSLVDFSKREPAVNTNAFPDMKHDDWYWTATPVAGYSGLAWCVGFRNGSVLNGSVDYSFYVRPVRASQ